MQMARGPSLIQLESSILCTELRNIRCRQELGILDPDDLIPKGVWTLDDIKAYGVKQGICPYFAVRRMVNHRCLPQIAL